MSGKEPGGLRLVYFEDLEPRFGIKFSEMTIHRKMNADPPQFPRNVLIGQRKAWYAHVVIEWLANLPTGKGRDPDPGNKRKGRKRTSKSLASSARAASSAKSTTQ